MDFKILVFRQATQYQNDAFDTVHTRLQQLATNCGFTNKDQEVKAQVVQVCYSTELRKKILEEPTLTLDQVRTKGRALEVASLQANLIEQRQSQHAMAISIKYRPQVQLNQQQLQYQQHGSFPSGQQNQDANQRTQHQKRNQQGAVTNHLKQRQAGN